VFYRLCRAPQTHDNPSIPVVPASREWKKPTSFNLYLCCTFKIYVHCWSKQMWKCQTNKNLSILCYHVEKHVKQ
jgi:hypothetical protein